MAENSAFIAASPDEVFATLSDGWTYSNWVVGTSHIRAVEADWPAVGSRLFHAAGAWPIVTRDESVVELCDPGRKLVLTARGWPFGEAVVSLELAAEGAGCRVTMQETPKSGPGRWLHNPLAEAALVRRNTESLARLACVVARPTEVSD